jgi:hypothetical protein
MGAVHLRWLLLLTEISGRRISLISSRQGLNSSFSANQPSTMAMINFENEVLAFLAFSIFFVLS